MRLLSVLRCTSKLPKDYSNFPESYIEKFRRKVIWKTPDGPQYQKKAIVFKKDYFGLHRPWEQEFDRDNQKNRGKEALVEPIKEWSFFKGDRVEVLVGKDKGKQGIVNYIVKERNWVIVEGLNCKYNDVKVPESGWICVKEEEPLLVTHEVSLIDPSDGKPTKVEWRFSEEGKKVRVSVRTGRTIPIPVLAEETYDFLRKHLYQEQPKDTTSSEVEKITFEPKLKTFAEDIMDEMGIKEDRSPYLTYWY